MWKSFPFVSGRHLFTAAGLAVILCLLGTNSALAHAQLIKSNPPDKAALHQAPVQVDLWFNELLDDGFNTIEIFPAAELSDKKHSNLAKGQPKVDPKDRTHLTVAVSALKPGKYVIQYRVLSRDGHSAPGRLTFQVSEGNN
jgi:methionine-rich copper-binding protein CopC